MYRSFLLVKSFLLFLLSWFIIFPSGIFGQPIPSAYDTLILIAPDIPIYLTFIPAGTFSRGSNSTTPMHQPDEAPVHEVVLTDDFYLGTYEVTQQQWQAVMNDNPAVFQTFADSPTHPVEYITWNQAQSFITQLNKRGIGTFRLPTEAEWEYACRAGTTTAYYWGDKMAENGSSEYVWANSRSFAQTHPVGTKKPSPWGLYDMSGNVWEWCQDWYAPYEDRSQIDPKGATRGEMKVFRGGSWFDFHEAHRSANRHKHAPDKPYAAIGFRLAWEDK
ncbi:MAG: formylglycine-generating enzyme family protein [Bacteroidota bacterium]